MHLHLLFTVNPCGEIPALSSVYLEWYFHPLEMKTYNLALSIKYYPSPTDINFGDFEKNDGQGNFGDGEDGTRNGNGSGSGNVKDYRFDNWREEREGVVEVQKEASALKSCPTGEHHSTLILI